MIRLWNKSRIHWRDEGSRVDISAYITLDCWKVTSRHLWGKGETSRAGIRTGTGTNSEKPFAFTNFDKVTYFYFFGSLNTWPLQNVSVTTKSVEGNLEQLRFASDGSP